MITTTTQKVWRSFCDLCVKMLNQSVANSGGSSVCIDHYVETVLRTARLLVDGDCEGCSRHNNIETREEDTEGKFQLWSLTKDWVTKMKKSHSVSVVTEGRSLMWFWWEYPMRPTWKKRACRSHGGTTILQIRNSLFASTTHNKI